MTRGMIDVGQGPPLVLVPGIQGRWEWMRPTVAALARDFRVLTFTLAGERTSRHAFDPALGFDNFVVQLDRVLDEAGVESAFLCGVSYGGLVALRYAAERPHRVRGLVLASALAPGYAPDARARFYMRRPTLLLPLFAVDAIRRSRPEVTAALPRWSARTSFRARQLWLAARAPATPRRMRDRLRLLDSIDFHAVAAHVGTPTLVVTGDPGLDRVVPVEDTLRYATLLPHAEVARLPRTGHLGLVTRPDDFARLLAAFGTRTLAASARGAHRVAG
jgi:pimeloyl-ACP methyl ester carboxylesterase